MGLFDQWSDDGHRISDDMPKVVREWHKPRPRNEAGVWVFALACGFIGLALLFGGCAMSVNVSGIGAALTFDPMAGVAQKDRR